MIATTESRNKQKIRNSQPNSDKATCGARILPENPGMPAMADEVETVFFVKDVEWILQVSSPTVQRLFDSGELSGWKIGTHRRIEPESVRAYIIRHGNRPGRLKRLDDRLEQLSRRRK